MRKFKRWSSHLFLCIHIDWILKGAHTRLLRCAPKREGAFEVSSRHITLFSSFFKSPGKLRPSRSRYASLFRMTLLFCFIYGFFYTGDKVFRICCKHWERCSQHSFLRKHTNAFSVYGIISTGDQYGYGDTIRYGPINWLADSKPERSFNSSWRSWNLRSWKGVFKNV